jgi:Phage tail lysozyme
MIESDFYGDRYRWFTGTVQYIGDDRSHVRVRIFGIHHTEDFEKIPNDALPWAMVLYPTTGGQTSGGNVSHNLTVGSWVVGFFADGIDSQQPIIVGVINGGQGSMNNSPRSSSANSTTPQSSNPSTTPSDIEPATTQLTGSTNQIKTYNYFWERISKEGSATGDIKVMVAAMVGNFMVESGDNINPQAYNGNDRGEASMGIAQWRGGKYDRVTPFLKFCGISSPVRPPSLPPLEQQLDYVWHELHTTEKTAYNSLLRSTTIDDATAAMEYYERDASYVRLNGVWTVDRSSPYYLKKLSKAKSVYASLSYTGDMV